MAYEFHGIEFLDMALEMQPLTQPAKLFGYILSIARLRSVQDQDASLVASHCGGDGSQSQLRQKPARQFHGRRCLLSVRMAWNSHDPVLYLLSFACPLSYIQLSRKDMSLVSHFYLYLHGGDISRLSCKR